MQQFRSGYRIHTRHVQSQIHCSRQRASRCRISGYRPRQVVPIHELPFFTGRGRENGNHLSLGDMRISRRCAVISAGPSGIVVEDRGRREGLFVNGQLASARALADGDLIVLGTDNGFQLVFRLQPEASVHGEAEARPRSTLGSQGKDSGDELNGLRLLLEATPLMHSQLPLKSVLATMFDHAVAITHADHGMLLEPDASGVLQVKVTRGRDGESLSPEAMNPSRSVLGSAIELESAVISEDLNLADIK